MSARERRWWPVTDLPVIVAALAAVLWLPGDQAIDPLAAAGLVALYVVACQIELPLGHGFLGATQAPFVAMLILAPARTVALLVLVAHLLGELIKVVARRKPLGRMPMIAGNCWYAVAPAVVVALAPHPVPWPWWVAAFAAGGISDVMASRATAWLISGERMPWRINMTTQLFDLTVTVPVAFACLQARGQAAAWMVPIGLVAMSAVIARERGERLSSDRRAGEDPLTGLANRRMFDQLLGAAQSRALRSARDGAVLIVDLDNFKAVNDELTHAVGDEVLRSAADRLRAVVRGSDVTARLGGDEFALILDDAEGAERVADAVRAAFHAPIEVGGHTCRVGASVGHASFGLQRSAADAVTVADHAMYDRKRLIHRRI
jgi:diguanylate cyclase (GGDEF)-like protein